MAVVMAMVVIFSSRRIIASRSTSDWRVTSTVTNVSVGVMNVCRSNEGSGGAQSRARVEFLWKNGDTAGFVLREGNEEDGNRG